MSDGRNNKRSLGSDIDMLAGLLNGTVETGVAMADIDAIIEDPDQPRREFGPAALEELAESIRAHGVLQPLLVQKVDGQGRHRLIAGARRLRASKLAGLAQVPIHEKEVGQVFAAQLVENLQRSDLTPLEIADGIKNLIRSGQSQADIAKALAKSKTWVSRYSAIANMPADLRQIVMARGCDDYNALSQLVKSHDLDPAGTLDRLRESNGPITRQTGLPIPTTAVGVAHEQLGRAEGVRHDEHDDSTDPITPSVEPNDSRAKHGASDLTELGLEREQSGAANAAAPRSRWSWAVNGRPVEPRFAMAPDGPDQIWVKDLGTNALRLVKAKALRLVGAETVQ